MSNRIQGQLQIRLKMLDDVFHNVIIALERLEAYLEQKRKGQSHLRVTAINTDRDLHNDQENPPTEKNLYLEMQTQCLALFFQTKFDKGDETFDKVVRYFLNDLLTWYGGRDESIPSNEVEKYFIPIMAAVSRFVETPPQISEIIKKYVIDIDTDISKWSDAEKEQAVIDGFTVFTRSSAIVNQRNKEFMESILIDRQFEFSSHERGSRENGLKRLLTYFMTEYDKPTPVNKLKKLVTNYAPDLSEIVEDREIVDRVSEDVLKKNVVELQEVEHIQKTNLG